MELHGSKQFQARTTGGARSLAKEPVPARVPEREVGKRLAAAKLQPHSSYVKASSSGGRPGLCRSSRGRLKPSNAAPGAGCAVIPVYRDLRQFPRGKSGVVLNVKKAGKKGSGANPASTLAKGLVPEKWQQFPKGKSHGERGDQGRWRSQRSRIGASSSEARSGRVRQAESPLQDGGVRDGASGVGGPLGVGNRRRARRLSRGRCSQFQVGRRPGRFDCTTEPGSSRCAGSRWL